MNRSVAERPLDRSIGWPTAAAIVVGTVIGSGIFKKPAAIAAALPYPGLVAVVWVVGAAVVLLGSLVYAEVIAGVPRTGGNYVLLRDGYGRLAGFLWAWVDFWVIRSAALAALATVFMESLRELAELAWAAAASGPPPTWWAWGWTRRLFTIGVLGGLAAVNVRGVGWGGRVQLVVTLIKVGSLLALAALPVAVWAAGRAAPSPAPLWPPGWDAASAGGLTAAFLGVWWTFHGWMNIGPVAGEVRDPQRAIPRALVGGTALVAVLYLGCNAAFYQAVPAAEMAGMADRPVATAAAERVAGPAAGAAVSAAILCSVFGALNGNILVGPRVLYALARDGLAPGWVRAVHPKWNTPSAAIVTLAAWASVLVVAEAGLAASGWTGGVKSPFNRLTDFAMFGAIAFDILAVMTIFRFRRRPAGTTPAYRCPGYPVVPVAYAVVPAFVLVNMFRSQQVEAFVGAGFVAAGAAAYYALGLYREGAALPDAGPR